MAGNGLHKEVRRKLYGFARRVARWVSDSRRQRFLQEMVVGLVIAGHVHLTKIARSLGIGANNVHADEKRLRICESISVAFRSAKVRDFSGAKGDYATVIDSPVLSRHLDSEHWSMQPVSDGLLGWSAEMVGDDTLIVADLTDIAKYYARHVAGLGRVRDASDPEKRTAPGYMLFEAYVRVRQKCTNATVHPGGQSVAGPAPIRSHCRKLPIESSF